MLPAIGIPTTGIYPKTLGAINGLSYSLSKDTTLAGLADGPRTGMAIGHTRGMRWTNPKTVNVLHCVPWTDHLTWNGEMQEEGAVFICVDIRERATTSVKRPKMTDRVSAMGLAQMNKVLHERACSEPGVWTPQHTHENYRFVGVLVNHPDLKGEKGTDRAIAVNAEGEGRVINYWGGHAKGDGDYLWFVIKMVPVDVTTTYVTNLDGTEVYRPGVTDAQKNPVKYVCRFVPVISDSCVPAPRRANAAGQLRGRGRGRPRVRDRGPRRRVREVPGHRGPGRQGDLQPQVPPEQARQLWQGQRALPGNGARAQHVRRHQRGPPRGAPQRADDHLEFNRRPAPPAALDRPRARVGRQPAAARAPRRRAQQPVGVRPLAARQPLPPQNAPRPTAR